MGLPRHYDKIRFRVSSLSGNCNRAIYLYASNAEEEPLCDTLKQAFQDGIDNEAKILRVASEQLKDAPYLMGYFNGEIETIETKYSLIQGHVDAIGKPYDNDELFLFEAKNLAPNKLSALRKLGVIGATRYYYTQIQLYLYGMTLKGFDIDTCIFVARNRRFRKDTDPKKYYVERIEYDESEVTEAINKADHIAYRVITEMPPEPDVNPFFEFFCQVGWCKYAKQCRAHWRNEFGYNPIQNK